MRGLGIIALDRRRRRRALARRGARRPSAGLLRIAFFLAIAFFLFLLWRERRSDIEGWSDLNRRVFYGAIVLAVVDVGAAIGLGASSGPDALAFILVFGACAYAIYRVWRNEHTYS